MIHFDVISIFPEMFSPILEQGIVAKALKNNLFSLTIHQLRNFSQHNNRNIDDSSYGGGGQVIMIEPLVNAVSYCKEKYSLNNNNDEYSKNNNSTSKIVYMSPQGKSLNQNLVNQLALEESHIIIVCGRYEGVDERFIEHYVDLEISVGDFVVSGGEVPAMLLIDAIARQQPNVMNHNSVKQDSFMRHLLDFPHYTKPVEYNGHKVPEILLSGNHAQINLWREQQAIAATLSKRPDLIPQD